MNNNQITVNQKTGIVVAVIVFSIMLFMYGAVIVEAFYLFTGSLTVTKISAGFVLAAILVSVYFFKKKTDKSYVDMNKKLSAK